MTYRLSRYIAAVAVCASLAGCADGLTGPDVPPGDGMVTITLKNSDGTRSAASDNSETVIRNAVVALYPSEYGDDQPAVILRKFDGIDKNTSATVQMKLTDEMAMSLFNATDGTSCKLYAVANVDMTGISDNATIAELKGVGATSRFDSQKVQDSFVMAGAGSVAYTVTGGKGTATGSGELVRAAAKISLNVKLPGEVTDADGNVWVPAISGAGGMRVILSNGVKTSVASPSGDIKPGEDDYYSITMKQAGLIRELPNSGDGSEYPCHIDVPFYTYPNRWEENPGEQHKTVMTLLVPWQKRGESQWNTYYYQVPVNNLTEIVPNYSYIVNLNVGMLGSLSPDTPEIVDELSYQIVDWSSENIDVEIKDTRYLVVSPKTFEVDNEANISFNYYSSHPVIITNIEMDYQRFNYYSNGNGDVVTFTINKDQIDKSKDGTEELCKYSVGQDNLGYNVVTIEHPLKIWTPYTADGTEVELTERENNESPEDVNKTISYYKPASTDESAYSPYVIRVTIRHADNEAYTETVTITQYPGMYILADRNPGGGTNTTSGGNVFINNAYNSRNLDDDLGSVTISLSGNNSNPNMYIISISTLGSGSEYIIGDPRMMFSNNNLSTYSVTGSTSGRYPRDIYGYPDMPIPTADGPVAGNWCKTAPALYPSGGPDRGLTYYYPTIESQDNQYKMMVAPKFRVASSYGKTSVVNRDGARRRMATYQERGCPAGRWRLPTYGELQFIISLSSTGKIPVLFTIGSSYWTAQGPCTVNANGTITLISADNYAYRDYYVRGVYDEWYWEEKPQYSITPSGNNFTYTLGDMPRNE